MQREIGDIWDHNSEIGSAIVIPTNIGWKGNNENVMGAGLAKEASRRFPHLAYRYGRWCQMHGASTPVVFAEDLGLILFPTKPLDVKSPHLSWRNNSTIERITQSLKELKDCKAEHKILIIYLPLVGCGNGGLEESVVLPLLEQTLPEPSYILVRQG